MTFLRIVSSNRHPSLAFWWSMIFFRKAVPTPDQVRGRLFRDHALGSRRIASDHVGRLGAVLDDAPPPMPRPASHAERPAGRPQRRGHTFPEATMRCGRARIPTGLGTSLRRAQRRSTRGDHLAASVGRLVHDGKLVAIEVENEQTDCRRQIAVLALGIDRGDEIRQGLVSSPGNLLQPLPEGILETHAGLVASDDDRTLDDLRFHGTHPHLHLHTPPFAVVNGTQGNRKIAPHYDGLERIPERCKNHTDETDSLVFAQIDAIIVPSSICSVAYARASSPMAWCCSTSAWSPIA